MKQVVLALVVAVLASVATFKVLGPGGEAVAAKESAYERVMRTGVLRCGYIDWLPYAGKDPKTGEVTGPGIEFAQKVAALLDLKLEFVMTTIGVSAEDMRQGRFDAMCFDGPWLVPTAKVVDYTKPWLYGAVFVYGKDVDAAKLDDPETTFIGTDGDLSVDLMPHLFPKAKVRTMPGTSDYAQLFLEIEARRADAVIIDEPSFVKFSSHNTTTIRKVKEEALAMYPCGMSVAKGEDKLRTMLDVATDMAIGMGFADRFARTLDPARTTMFPAMLGYKAGGQ